jgi:RNA polymerase sigma factor (sigma-70 family)
LFVAEPEPTIFIVDDDEVVRDSLSRLMETVSLKAKAFPSAQQFLDAYDHSQPGCLVLDVRMPGMSGLKLQDELLARNMTIPIIFISGYGELPLAVEALRKGAIDFIEKPVGDQVLLERIQEALAKDARTRKEQAKREAIEAKLALLSPREREVIELVRAGKPNRVIAEELGLSQRTVEVHRAGIMEKLQVSSVIELVTMVYAVKGAS